MTIGAVLALGLTVMPATHRALAEDQAQNETDAQAAVSALLPTGSTAAFRNLVAFVQRPGEAFVCGEIAAQRPDGRTGEWRAFMAGRTPAGWRARINPTATTIDGYRACSAERSRLVQSPGFRPEAPEVADLQRRCPMELTLFWIDHQMVCAGHPLSPGPAGRL